MTKIIGHRGAAGITLENTIESIKTAKKYKVDAIEVDVRKTKDAKLVLSHDKDLKKLSMLETNIADLTLSELKKIKLYNDETVAELQDAIKASATTPLIIEIKEDDTAPLIIEIINSLNAKHIILTSLKHDELRTAHKLRPDIPILVRDMLSPIDIVATAHKMEATGINLNAWQMNPLTYWLAKRYDLDVMVYSVDSPFLVDFLNYLYPGIMICTNRPDRFVKKKKIWTKHPRTPKSLR